LKIKKAVDRTFGDGSYFPNVRAWPPKWLLEWRENQGQYVELQCGHMVDLNDRSIAPMIHPREQLVDCSIHRSWQPVSRKVTFHEYAGIRVKPIPDEPLF
jgi:Zn ribbon nucleic-acid-binding protein